MSGKHPEACCHASKGSAKATLWQHPRFTHLSATHVYPNEPVHPTCPCPQPSQKRSTPYRGVR